MYYLPSKFRCLNFNILGFNYKGGGGGEGWSQKTKKKARSEYELVTKATTATASSLNKKFLWQNTDTALHVINLKTLLFLQSKNLK